MLRVVKGSLPVLRTGTKPAPSSIAIAVPKMKPRASIAATSSIPWPFQWRDITCTDSARAARSAISGVMSRNMIPGIGKSGMVRMWSRRFKSGSPA